MQTYKYNIKAKTGAVSTEMLDMVKYRLEERLIESPECLMSYVIFPTDGDILEHVDMNMEGGSLESISLNTYSKLWDGSENDLFDCVAVNLNEIHNEMPELPIIELPEYTGDDKVRFLGREGSIPDKLYHIVEAKNLDEINRDGIIPGTGKNTYKDTEKHVYLTDEKDLPAWLSVLPHTKEPVILEVNTDGLEIEYGRHYSDRNYLPEGYGEYRTSEHIPVKNIHEADMGHGFNEFASGICSRIDIQLNNVMPDSPEFREVSRGLDRLVYMGLMKEDEARAKKASHIADVQNAGGSLPVQDDDEMQWTENGDEKITIKDGEKVILKNGMEQLLFGPVADFYKENGFAYFRNFGNGDTFISNEQEKVSGVTMITMDTKNVALADENNFEHATTAAKRTTGQNFGKTGTDYSFVPAESQKLWKYQFDMENIQPDDINADTVYSPMNSDMAPYESGRFEEILMASRIPGKSNIDGIKFEPNDDGSVDKMSVYMKKALTRDMEVRVSDYITGKILPEFNSQSDDVNIELRDMARIGKVDVSDKEFDNDFSAAVASISAGEELKLQ